jgi:hypothetical protein
MLTNIPDRSLERLLRTPGSAALRVFVVICAAADDGVARVSARDLAQRSGLTERSVFYALTELETLGCITRRSRSPGPGANEITVVDTISTEHTADSLVPDAITDSAVAAHQTEETLQDAPPDILKLVASCYRDIDSVEALLVREFISDWLGGDDDAFADGVAALRSSGGVASDAPLSFYLTAIRDRARKTNTTKGGGNG